LRWPGISADQKGFRIDGGFERSQQHIRPVITGEEVDPVRLDQFFGFLLADIRLLLVVLVDYLDGFAVHLAADVVEREFKAVARIVADRGARAAKGVDKSDLDGVACPRRARHGKHQGARKPECRFHEPLPLSVAHRQRDIRHVMPVTIEVYGSGPGASMTFAIGFLTLDFVAKGRLAMHLGFATC
jgi:hypothetical protein